MLSHLKKTAAMALSNLDVEDAYRIYVPQIIAYCRKYIPDENVVMKIVEFVFEKYEEKKQRFKFTERSLEIYLRICARSCITNYLVNHHVRKN